MTPDLLASLFAVILSLLASYLPGFSNWYAALDTVAKRLFMAGGLLIITAGIAGLACAGYASQIGVTLTCDMDGLWIALKSYFAAIAVNQAAYQLTRRVNSNQAPGN